MLLPRRCLYLFALPFSGVSRFSYRGRKKKEIKTIEEEEVKE
jgi:hypothetical protein